VNSTPAALLAIAGGAALLVLAGIGALAVYDAVADDDMMGGMWDMMDDMSGMMDDGMMGGRGQGNETTGTASGQGEVRIIDFDYKPSVLEVTPGTVIKWTNEDGAPHTFTVRVGPGCEMVVFVRPQPFDPVSALPYSTNRACGCTTIEPVIEVGWIRHR